MSARLRGLHRKCTLSGQETGPGEKLTSKTKGTEWLQVEQVGGPVVNKTIVLRLLMVSPLHPDPMSHMSEVGREIIQLDLRLLEEDDHSTHGKECRNQALAS